jgi:hypothetical protein
LFIESSAVDHEYPRGHALVHRHWIQAFLNDNELSFTRIDAQSIEKERTVNLARRSIKTISMPSFSTTAIFPMRVSYPA